MQELTFQELKAVVEFEAKLYHSQFNIQLNNTAQKPSFTADLAILNIIRTSAIPA